jgi:nucleoid-associated protein YgaU
MGFSVRVALMICLGSIGGMSWVVQQFSVPRAEANPAAGMGAGPAAFVSLAGMSGGPTSGDTGRQRVEWVRQFARPSALEVQADVNRTQRDALACLPPSSPVEDEVRTVGLPPLAYDANLVLASAAPVDAAWTPDGDGEVVLAAAADGAGEMPEPAPVPEQKRYRVGKGDTLTRIAQQSLKSSDRRLVDLLSAANPQVRQRGGRILVGEELVIPDAATVQRVLSGGRPVPTAEPVAVATADAAPKTADAQWYTIQRNDSLASIAQRFLKDGRRWREIAALNAGLDPHKIVPGLRIKLPPVIRMAHG